MAKRSLAGQMNMFEFWSQLTSADDGAEVEMVSLMPDEAAEEPAPEENDAAGTPVPTGYDEGFSKSKRAAARTESRPTADTDAGGGNQAQTDVGIRHISYAEKIAAAEAAPVMRREFFGADNALVAEIAFYNYNRVCLRQTGEAEIWREFDNSKDAVDYYMEQMNIWGNADADGSDIW